VLMVLAVGRRLTSTTGWSGGLGPLAETSEIVPHRVRLRSGGSGAVQDLGLADLAIAHCGPAWFVSADAHATRLSNAPYNAAVRDGKFGYLSFLGCSGNLGRLRQGLFSGIG